MDTTKFEKLGACSDAVDWLKTQPSISVAWGRCRRGDWMLWLLGRLDTSAPWSEERRPIVAAALDCAMLAEKYVRDDDFLAYVWCCDSLQRWIDGEDNREEIEAARSAAATTATYAATYAAYYAAYAAYYAAYYADATTAAYAATYAAYATYDASSARENCLAECADIVRAHKPKPPKF